jgi:hypothetical protein
MKEELETWRRTTGLEYLAKPEEDMLKNALEMSPKKIVDLDLRDLDALLIILANYHVYLSAQLGVISAKVSFLEDQLLRVVGPVASKYSAGSAVERRAIAIQRADESVKKMDGQLSTEKIKLEMLRPVCDAVRTKIDTMRRIYDRRARERN